MNYREIIETALSTVGCPVAFQKYNGTLTTYITYFCYNEQGDLFAENEEVSTYYSIQVDIWSKSRDYEALESNIKTALSAAGFTRDYAQDLYESDTKTFHKVLRFNLSI